MQILITSRLYGVWDTALRYDSDRIIHYRFGPKCGKNDKKMHKYSVKML